MPPKASMRGYTPKGSPKLTVELNEAGLDELDDRIAYQENVVLRKDPANSYEKGRLDGLLEAKVLLTSTPIKPSPPKAEFKKREVMTQADKDYNSRHDPVVQRQWIDQINENTRAVSAKELDFIESVAAQLGRGRELSEKQLDWLEAIYNKV